MEILGFQFDGLQNLQLHLQLLEMLNQVLSLILEVFDGLLVICNFPQELSIDCFFVEIFMHQIFCIVNSLDNSNNTVAVLISLNANSTVLNFSISFSILFLSILLTKIWVRNMFLQFF